jgi:NAD(P)-dependent dehydrogenase (short-subunit alcohol dehydrogenase family)
MATLVGKIAIVTGAGQDIGRGTAPELAKAGAKVALAGIRDKSTNQVKAEIEATASGGPELSVAGGDRPRQSPPP